MKPFIPREGNLVRDWVFWVWVKEVIMSDSLCPWVSRNPPCFSSDAAEKAVCDALSNKPMNVDECISSSVMMRR